MPSPSILRFHIFNKAITATINVKGAVVFAGSLRAGVEDLSKVHADDSFTVLTADMITGQFANVASGGSINVYSAFDSLGEPIGDPVGTFRVTYNQNALVLDNFQPSSAPTAAEVQSGSARSEPDGDMEGGVRIHRTALPR